MQERELTLITSTNTWISYAAVLDKANVQLSDVFYEALGDLQEDLTEGGGSDASFATFCSRVGTHYANAVTFGSKVYLVATSTNQQIVQIINQGIDTSAGLDFGESEADVYGLKISEGETHSFHTETAQDNYTKLSSILQIGKDDIKVIGGHSGEEATDSALVPVMLDLRPISNLLAPPFFNDWNIIGLHPESLRSRLANYIQSYAYYKIDAQGERVARLHRLTYKSNRVVQCMDRVAPNFPPTERTNFGGEVSVTDTALFDFSLFAGSQQLKDVFRLHDCGLATADQVRVTVEVPIIQYLTVLGMLIPPESTRSLQFFPLSMDLFTAAEGYSISDELAHYRQTGGKARPYSFTIDINAAPPEFEQILPWLCLGGDLEPAVLCGWATFTMTPVETAQALGLD
jgi:MAC/Perforin domain